jgi:signal transduction histidine kinase
VSTDQPAGLAAALPAPPQRVVGVLSGVLDTLPVSVIVVESVAPYRLVYLNPRAMGVVPQERRPIAGRPWAELWEGVAEAGVLDVFAAAASTGEPQHLSGWEFVHPAGSPLAGRVSVWDWIVYPVAGDDGRATSLLITALDLTDQRLAEELEQARSVAERQRFDELALIREVAQALSATLDEEQAARHVVQIAATIVSPPGRPTRRASLLRLEGGDRLVSIAEYDAEGPRLGETVYALADHSLMAEVVRTQEPRTGTFPGALEVPDETRQRVSSSRLLSYALAPVHVGDALFGIITIGARDDAGFDDAQMQRLSAVANISGLALGNAMRFTLARDHAQRVAAVERAKSDFLNLASHELRGPLTVVRGYMSMLADGTLGALSGRISDVIPVVTERLEAMNRIVDQIIDTARLADHESAPVRLQAADLREIVEAAIGEAATGRAAQHTLVVDLAAGPVPVRADPRRMSIAVAHLVDNALKFSPGGGEVTVRCLADAERGVAVVSVRDRGLGIAAADLPRIFSRFGRIVTPENSAIAGTGLGLHLARDTVRRHGGDITVESAPGEGSTFTLTLPLLDEGS